MSGSNFPNGSLVMRIWRFDGNGELLAKFQYFGDARDFADTKARNERADIDVFYLAVCDHENSFQCFFPPKKEASK